jgi:hypothetical protein
MCFKNGFMIRAIVSKGIKRSLKDPFYLPAGALGHSPAPKGWKNETT